MSSARDHSTQSPLDRPLTVTFFPNFAAYEKREEVVSLRALAPRIKTTTRPAKTQLPWLKLAKFGGKKTELVRRVDGKLQGGSLRNNDNVLLISGIEADYDHEITAIDDAVRVLREANVAAMVYTSPSHTEDAPRWRVLCPLSRDWTPDMRASLLSRLNGLFQGSLSGESFTLSQSYYWGSVKGNPSHCVELVEGDFLDDRADLDAGAIGKTKIEYDRIVTPQISRQENKSKFIEAVIRNALSKIASAPDGQKHNTLRAQARLLGGYQYVGGYTIAEAVRWLVDALPASTKDRKAAAVTAEWGLERGIQAPIQIEDRNVVYLTPPEPPPEIDDPGYWSSVAYDAAEPPDDEPPELPQIVVKKVYDPWNAMRPVAPPVDAIPFAIRSYVEGRARIIGADAAAMAWSCLSACSAAIDGRVRLQMKRHDRWSVPPSIWVSLIGQPSTKKSPIIDTAWAPLNRIQGGALKKHQIDMAEWKSLPKDEKARQPEPPMPRRLVSHDATMESLQDIMGKQDRGIGILRDELAGWIGAMEKYAAGKGSAADRAFWLQAYNGGEHVVDRVQRGTVSINNLLVTVCGGIQPDRLRTMGDLTDDGLFQRFVPLIVAPATIGDDDEEFPIANIYGDIIERLLLVRPDTRLTLEEDAHTIRADVQRRLFALEQSEVLGPRFVGFVGKLIGLWGRLALVLHLVSEPGSLVVRAATANAARTLIFRSVLPNAARVYAAMGGAGGDTEATQSVAGYILNKNLDRIVVSDLTRNVRVCRGRSLEEIRKLLSPLEAGGWIAPEKEFGATSWLVADQVHTQFTAQAEKERTRRDHVRSLIIGDECQDG